METVNDINRVSHNNPKKAVDINPEGLYVEICLAIREKRKAKRLSQGALGKKIGMMQRHISEIERGVVMPRLDTLLEILRVLGLDLVLVSSRSVPIVRSFVREETPGYHKKEKDRPLYAVDDDDNDEGDNNA